MFMPTVQVIAIIVVVIEALLDCLLKLSKSGVRPDDNPLIVDQGSFSRFLRSTYKSRKLHTESIKQHVPPGETQTQCNRSVSLQLPTTKLQETQTLPIAIRRDNNRPPLHQRPKTIHPQCKAGAEQDRPPSRCANRPGTRAGGV